jgi:plastocyanin
VQWEFLGSHRRFDGRRYGLHSVAFLPDDDRAPYPLMRADEWSVALNEPSIFGSGCGRGGQPACVVEDPNVFVSSGFPTLDGSPFRARIELGVGRYRYFCMIFPKMEGAIEVVPDDEPLQTQAEIDDEVAHQIAADSRLADDTAQQLSIPRFEIVDGTREWTVHAGAFTPDGRVDIQAFLPARLPALAEGDRVRWKTTGFFHSVTFPAALVGGPDPVPNGLGGLGVLLGCDPDDRTSGLPGAWGFWGIRGPACPANLEVLVSPWVFRPFRAPGDAVVAPATYHHSGGIVAADFPASGRPPAETGIRWADRFDAAFPVRGTYPYRCMVHPATMSGWIEVGK